MVIVMKNKHIDTQENPQQRLLVISNLLLFLSTFFFVIMIVLGIYVYRLNNREIRLENISSDQRLRLVEEADRIAPPIYQSYPTSGSMLFYRMKSNTHYVNVLGDNFTTNDLGFRTINTSPKAEGKMRIVIVGDSWTFGPSVKYEQTFSYRLQELLNRNGKNFEVYNLSMLGWNTENQIAALRVFLSQLKPDFVVICPTSNDIDETFDVWNGRLVSRGFESRAIFRYSYEYQRRWIANFKTLQKEVDFLKQNGIPSLIYFLAEWRTLVPYYAELSSLKARYIVVPTDFIDSRYRLESNVDPGRHASPEGHRLIAEYLYNALLKLGAVTGTELNSPNHPVTFPGDQYDPGKVEAEFGFWWEFAQNPDLIPLNEGYMARKGIFSVLADSSTKKVSAQFELLDEPGLYPLTIEIRLASKEKISQKKIFDHYFRGLHEIEVEKPKSLDKYPIIEVHVLADRVVSLPNKVNPVSIKRPAFKVY